MSKEKFKNKNHTSHFALHISKQKGITLIALIITIIVMLILTGVTLSITLGDNGLVNKAQEASEEMQVAMDRELLLSAAIGAMGNDGKVNLSAINLPEGFTGSNGTYTSSNGHTFTVSQNGEVVFAGSDDIIENGGEVETVNLDGVYYSFIDAMEMEINGKQIAFPKDSYYQDGELTVDHTTKSGIMVFNYKPEEDGTTYESQEIPFIYETVVENNSITNIILYYVEEGYGTLSIACKDRNNLEYDLEGDYISEDGENKITFKASEPDWDSLDDYMSYTGNMHEYNKSGDEWVISTSGGTEEVYFKINNKYFMEYELVTVSDDKNTIEWQGETYTKQTAD